MLGLFASGFGVVSTLRSYLVSDADRQLQRTLSVITPETITSDEQSRVTDFVVARFDAQGKLLDSNSAWMAISPNVRTSDIGAAFASHDTGVTVRNDDGMITLRMVAKPLNDGTVVVLGLPFDNSNRIVAQLLTLFFLFGAIVIVVGAVLTRLLIITTLAPLRQVERTAAAIAGGDFGQRLDDTSTSTEIGRLNRSLNRMLTRIDTALADRARTIDQMRRFISDASHELRTPLVSVRGYAELYRMGAIQTEEDVTQAMDRIEREAIRLSTLVSDLLSLARLDEARELKLTPVELLPLAHDAALDARALAPDRAVRVITSPATSSLFAPLAGKAVREDNDAALTTASRFFRRSRQRGRLNRLAPATESASIQDDLEMFGTGPVINADEDKIRQLLTNLIANAIRYTPEGSPIEIAAYRNDIKETAILEVVDHGEGIPAQVRDKIFERFWRVDSSRTRDTGGSGLGLAIVTAIVAAHNGTIGVYETPGGGATFRVEIPLRDEGPHNLTA
jgi:two-component system OmpR family sensor kinase